MRKRHSGGHNNGMGGGHNHRRNNNNRGGGGHQNGQRGGPPRKNFAALRERYLNMAKDAMASGDRILAEYYLQHADHYYRMQQEFLEQRNKWREQQPAGTAEADAEEESAEGEGSDEPDVDIPNNSNVLPAFLTRKVEAKPDQNNDDKMPVQQDWDEQ